MHTRKWMRQGRKHTSCNIYSLKFTEISMSIHQQVIFSNGTYFFDPLSPSPGDTFDRTCSGETRSGGASTTVNAASVWGSFLVKSWLRIQSMWPFLDSRRNLERRFWNHVCVRTLVNGHFNLYQGGKELRCLKRGQKMLTKLSKINLK